MNDNRKSAAGRNIKLLNDVALERLLNEVIEEASARPSLRSGLIRILGDSLVEVKLEQFGRLPGQGEMFDALAGELVGAEPVA